MRLPIAAAAIALAFTSGCALAPAHTDAERELLDTAQRRDIAPASRAERRAIAEQSLVAQGAFWAEQYENNPADRDSAVAFADISRRLGNPARAATVANQALTLHPEDPDLLRILGAALIEDGRAEAAVGPLERLVARSRDDAHALNVLGAALDSTGRHGDAQTRYREALRLSPDDVAVLTNLGLSYVLAGDPAEGERHLRRAAELPGADARVRANLALSVAVQGRFQEAEAIAQQDLSADEAAANIAYVRAMLSGPRRWEAASLRGSSED